MNVDIVYYSLVDEDHNFLHVRVDRNENQILFSKCSSDEATVWSSVFMADMFSRALEKKIKTYIVANHGGIEI